MARDKYPRNESKSFVMRIVGLPGERIEMVEGTVSINGVVMGPLKVFPEMPSIDANEIRSIKKGVAPGAYEVRTGIAFGEVLRVRVEGDAVELHSVSYVDRPIAGTD